MWGVEHMKEKEREQYAIFENYLSDEQEIVLNELIKWVENRTFQIKEKKIKVVRGFAGTGKTFLISELVKNLKKNRPLHISLCCFTGKAVSVLKKRLKENNALYDSDYIGTVHKMMYKPIFYIENGQPKLKKWEKINIYSDLIIVDEASMINKKIFQDIIYHGIQTIFFGDAGQLPPISPENFNLLECYDYELTTPHRQSLENPIIQLSQKIRNDEIIKVGIYGDGVFKLNNTQGKKVFEDILNNDYDENNTIVLCGLNRTRVELNKKIRKKLRGFEGFPNSTDRIICLKNNSETGIMNGQLGTLVFSLPSTINYCGKKLLETTIKMDDHDIMFDALLDEGTFNSKNSFINISKTYNKKFFKFLNKNIKYSNYLNIDFFDYGYCLSVHKSQGSEWENVIVFEETSKYWNMDFYKKWLYTAVTRAKKKLFIIGME